MAFSFRMQLFAAVLYLSLLSQVLGHSYMTSPVSRSDQGTTQTGCRGPACLGPCDIPLASAKRPALTIARGATIVVNWPRNNHAGGFIRLAWAPTAQSDNHAAFDAHVQQITCHEIGNPTLGQCAPSSLSDPNGGGSGPGDGSSGACNTKITVPRELTDGKWTLQWAWFGGAFSLGDYYSCTDYVISGGDAVGPQLAGVFKGGDFTYPNQNKCKFFNTDKLHICTNEPCQSPIYALSQEQSGVPAAGQLSGGAAVTPTTGAAAPSTTGKPAPSTTGRVVNPATTPTPAPTPAPVNPTPSTSGSVSSCAGTLQPSTSTASITAIDVWGNNNNRVHMVITVDVAENVLSNWVVQVTWPQGSSNNALSYFNAGTLQCEDSSKTFFKPNSWANNQVKGSSFQVEFIATNSNGMSANALAAATRIAVLKK